MSGLQLAALTLFGCSVAAAYSPQLFRRIYQDKSGFIATLSATAALLLVNCLRLSLPTGPDIHFLLVSALFLTLGFWAALYSATAVWLIITATGMLPVALSGMNGLCFVLLPVTLTYAIYALTFYRIPRHFIQLHFFMCVSSGRPCNGSFDAVGRPVVYCRRAVQP